MIFYVYKKMSGKLQFKFFKTEWIAELSKSKIMKNSVKKKKILTCAESNIQTQEQPTWMVHW